MGPRFVALLLVAIPLAGCMGSGSSKDGPPDALHAAFEASPEVPAVGEPVQFTDRSTGAIFARSWSFGDGSMSEEENPSHAYDRAGLFEVRLVVYDSAGAADEATLGLTVGELQTGPQAGFRVDFGYAVSGLTVEFEPRVEPPDAVVDLYHWEFGDGTVSKFSAPQHTYTEAGLYTVTLRASSQARVSEAKRIVGVGVDSAAPSALAERSFAVIALVDTGVNPYHSEFADPEFTAHPASYISDYPDTALELSLTLDARSYNEAVKKDEETWSDVKGGKLYWIPGTRIIGAISVAQDGSHKILDDDGHGSATASDAAGATVGTCPECLLVIVEGLGDAPLQWALDQPWIDVVSNSWNYCGLIVTCQADTGVTPPVLFSAAATRAAVERGKEVVFAAGNGMLNLFDAPTTTYFNSNTGPDWILVVGAADSQSGATIVGTGRPFDITSYGFDWKGASHQSTSSITAFSGTSAAAPVAAGAYAYVLRETRERLGDTAEGPRKGAVLAEGEPGAGFLADGKLTRAEAERALLLTAKPASGGGPVVPASLPHSAAAFLYSGYGLVNAQTAREAAKVVAGDAAAPARPNEDQWAAVDGQVRRSIWGSWDPGLDYATPSADPRDVDMWLDALGMEVPASAA